MVLPNVDNPEETRYRGSCKAPQTDETPAGLHRRRQPCREYHLPKAQNDAPRFKARNPIASSQSFLGYAVSTAHLCLGDIIMRRHFCRSPTLREPSGTSLNPEAPSFHLEQRRSAALAAQYDTHKSCHRGPPSSGWHTERRHVQVQTDPPPKSDMLENIERPKRRSGHSSISEPAWPDGVKRKPITTFPPRLPCGRQLECVVVSVTRSMQGPLWIAPPS